MPVVVLTNDSKSVTEGEKFDIHDNGALFIFDKDAEEAVAVYAPGTWRTARVEGAVEATKKTPTADDYHAGRGRGRPAPPGR